MNQTNLQAFRRGFRDGIPIGLGYLAVSFSLGIAARNVGLNAFQGFLMSLLNNASAGEYAGLTVIAANSPYLEIAIQNAKRIDEVNKGRKPSMAAPGTKMHEMLQTLKPYLD